GHLSSSGNLTASFSFNYGGSAFANNGSWTSASDVRIKRDVNRIENPFEKMRKIRGATWYRKDSGEFGIGMIAQEIQEVFPDAVKTNGFSLTLPDGEVVKDVLFPDTAGVAAALHHEAILALMDQIEDLKKQVEALRSGS
ncbi:tail fiber domain-containing protein, partial [Enterobacter roggenkampii]